jgi:hypothetical protein
MIRGCAIARNHFSRRARGVRSSRFPFKALVTFATSAAIAALAATTARTFLAGSCHADVQSATAQIFAIQTINGFLRFFRGTHGYKCKPTRPASGPVSYKVGFNNGTVRGEGFLQVVFSDFEIEIPDE